MTIIDFRFRRMGGALGAGTFCFCCDEVPEGPKAAVGVAVPLANANGLGGLRDEFGTASKPILLLKPSI